jgi:transcriptional regulator
MYTPAHFRVEDEERLFDFIEQHPLGLLVTGGAAGLLANPIPMLLDRHARILRGHVARANPVWQEFETGGDVLAVFQGPDHYVTPAWYATKQETGKVVPTWNYMMAQARGPARSIHDPAWLRTLVGNLTERHEAARPVPWSVADAPADFIDAQLRAIVGFEISIASLSGKFKISQNRSVADRAGVVRGMEEQGGAGLSEVTEEMRRTGRRV